MTELLYKMRPSNHTSSPLVLTGSGDLILVCVMTPKTDDGVVIPAENRATIWVAPVTRDAMHQALHAGKQIVVSITALDEGEDTQRVTKVTWSTIVGRSDQPEI